MSGDAVTLELVQRLKEGDNDAASAIFQRFARRLIGLARMKMDDRLKQKVDAEDIVQSVFRSFFVRSARGEFEFQNGEGVWALLVLLTVRKCGRRVAHFRTDRRDIRREHARHNHTDDSDAATWEAMANDPTPAEAAVLVDTTEVIMRRLGNERKQKIFELSLQGYSIPEISVAVGYYERGVERVRAEVRQILEQMIAQAPLS